MNEPRPTPSHPQSHSHPQGMPPVPGQPALRPAVAQPQRSPGASQGSHAGHTGHGSHAPQGQPRAVPPLPPLPSAHKPAAADDGLIALDDEEPIALEESPSAPVTPAAPRLPAAGIGGASASQASASGLSAPSKIKFAQGGDKHTYLKFKRPTHVTGTGACRVRSFHGRLSDDGLAFMDDKINEWLDNHPDVEVKFVNCFTGPLEGKVTGEQGLIVTLWY